MVWRHFYCDRILKLAGSLFVENSYISTLLSYNRQIESSNVGAIDRTRIGQWIDFLNIDICFIYDLITATRCNLSHVTFRWRLFSFVTKKGIDRQNVNNIVNAERGWRLKNSFHPLKLALFENNQRNQHESSNYFYIVHKICIIIAFNLRQKRFPVPLRNIPLHASKPCPTPPSPIFTQ